MWGFVFAFLATVTVISPDEGPESTWQAWIADPGVKFVLVGEVHGQVGPPALAARILEDAVRLDPQSRILLLIETSETEAFDSYLKSDGSEVARATFIHGARHWRDIDGRASVAVFDLIERARVLVESGADITAQGIIPPTGDFTDSSRWDGPGAELTRQVFEAGEYDIAIGWMGNLHSRPAYPLGRERSLSSFGAELDRGDVRAITAYGRRTSGVHACPLGDGNTHHLAVCVDRTRAEFVHPEARAWRERVLRGDVGLDTEE